MRNYSETLELIKANEPKPRGLAFEKLINNILDDKKLLIQRSYVTYDSSQQIDGAIEVNSRIFLLEVKWEQTETLAASKLYSFLGKINSKIDGTIGIFISYNRLAENFLNSVRNGIQQKCLIIHGAEDISALVSEELDIEGYIWYLFQQASVKGRIEVPITEFLSIPNRNNRSRQVRPDWAEIYNSLVGSDSLPDFALKLNQVPKDQLGEIGKNIINLYPALKVDSLTSEKLKNALEKINEETQNIFSDELGRKLAGLAWENYCNETAFSLFSPHRKIPEKYHETIVNQSLKFLADNLGSYDQENLASLAIQYIIKDMTHKLRKQVASAFLIIYCDKDRKDRYPQKKLANKIFEALDEKEISQLARKAIHEFMEYEKSFETAYNDDQDKIKERVIHITKRKFEKVLGNINDDELKNLFHKL